MTSFCRILLIFGIFVTSLHGQAVEDDVFHFTNPSQGNAVWILDESSLPWTGGYQFLRSISGMPTTLLSVVDSSTGVTLGQCVAPQDTTGNLTKRWEQFTWILTSSGLDCSFESSSIPSRSQFVATANPRTFSIRIQSVTGPACLRDLTVHGDTPTGCPPHLSKNSFTAIAFNCSCPYLDAANEDAESENEDVDMLANNPQFPIFKGIEPSSEPAVAWTLSPSPCAGHECFNNGTCLVSQEGAATCLCRNGFTGDKCELDVCSTVPCQNGGVCRSNNGIAFCECPPSFTGLLCQSTSEEDNATPKCTPECSNGQCVSKDGNAQCECRQGFTGANCNVLDVCLGDAACSVYGPTAKCVLDDNMDKMTSVTLINGTYDCLCPHPIHGQFVDCMTLHAPSATSAQPADNMNVTPSFPVLEISKIPTGEPTTNAATTPVFVPVVSTTQLQNNNMGQTAGFTVTREPMRPAETFATTLPPPFNQHIITAGETQQQPIWTSQQPAVENTVPTQTQPTFIFPQTPETSPVTIPNEQHTTQPVHKFVSPVGTDHEEEEEEEEEETDETFPTPSTMHVVPNNFESSTTTMFETSSTVPTTTEMEEEEEEDMTTEDLTESTTQPSTTVFIHPSTMTTQPPTTTVDEETTTEDVSEDLESEELQTTQTSLPFWMTSTTTKEVPRPSPTPMVIVPHPDVQVPMTSTEAVPVEESEEMTTASNEELATKNMEVTTRSDVEHHHTSNGKQSSAAVSWIVAIIALIILGLLLLATSLFILRYIRQSRKLHGKYNPAREEHNLSAAYAMPMSHIAKEERLI